MLVLGRKTGERIIIDNDITVTVLQISGNRVKLGLDCPPEIPIHREELYGKLVGTGDRLECVEIGLRPTGQLKEP